jgi:hypothetical protein
VKGKERAIAMIDEIISRHEHDCMTVYRGHCIWKQASFGFTSLMAWVFIVHCV